MSTILIPAKTMNTITTNAKNLYADSYRIEPINHDGLMRVFNILHPQSDYWVDIKEEMCNCEGFINRKVCKHLSGAGQLMLDQASAYGWRLAEHLRYCKHNSGDMEWVRAMQAKGDLLEAASWTLLSLHDEFFGKAEFLVPIALTGYVAEVTEGVRAEASRKAAA